MSSLYWTHTAGDRFLMNVNASFSLYDYRLSQNVSGYYESRKMGQLQRKTEEVSETRYDSKVKDASITATSDFALLLPTICDGVSKARCSSCRR